MGRAEAARGLEGLGHEVMGATAERRAESRDAVPAGDGFPVRGVSFLETCLN
jgi:hypothetical protein